MKKGFTLIELLAVIVILAIIALIATPIILGIINDAREESNERSVELYASAVRNGIAAYQLREGKEIASGSYTTDTLPFEVEYDGKVDCTSVIISEDGKVSLEGCTVNGGEKQYSYGIEEDETPTTPVAKVCTIEKQDASKYSVGDVVTCNIGETPDKFYVIEEQPLTASTIQMLTEKNIHTTEYRQSDDYCPVAFSSTNYWSSETDVYDDRNDIIKPIVDEYVSYLNTKLAGATGNLLTFIQVENLGGDSGASPWPSAPTWLYSTSYWTSTAYYTNAVWAVYGRQELHGAEISTDSNYGVRPVITISTSEIQ